MSESFSIGEHAIFWRPGSRYHLLEVVITGALKERRLRDARNGSIRVEAAYQIDGQFLTQGPWAAPPRRLKKIPPRQDWVTLANLTTRELETA